METLFTLRPAREADLELLDAYNAAEGMDRLPGVEGVTVAVDAEDIPVGYIRLVDGEVPAGECPGSVTVAHVYPIVVYEPWRGYGVGRALMDDALARTGELRLIARGTSRGFYEALGFAPVGFDAVDTAVTEDCASCPYRAQCEPQPMALVRP